MAKYTFSQGKVSVEAGPYRPILRDRPPALDSVVILLLPPTVTLPEPIATSDKEVKPLQSPTKRP